MKHPAIAAALVIIGWSLTACGSNNAAPALPYTKAALKSANVRCHSAVTNGGMYGGADLTEFEAPKHKAPGYDDSKDELTNLIEGHGMTQDPSDVAAYTKRCLIRLLPRLSDEQIERLDYLIENEAN